MPGPAGGASSGSGVAVVQAALTRVGSPYSWGATGPDAFDLRAFHTTALALGPVGLAQLRTELGTAI